MNVIFYLWKNEAWKTPIKKSDILLINKKYTTCCWSNNKIMDDVVMEMVNITTNEIELRWFLKK